LAVEIRPARIDDAVAMAPLLREQDRLEAVALTGMEPAAALLRQVKLSRETWIAETATAPVCMFGVNPPSLTSPDVMPWMATTHEMERHPVEVARLAQRILPGLLEGAVRARGYVLQTNRLAIVFLRFLRFTVAGDHRFRGRMFHQFRMEVRDVL